MALNRERAPRNRTLSINSEEASALRGPLITISSPATVAEISGKILFQDLFHVLPFLPTNSIDLLVIDPPYNLTKSFGNQKFLKTNESDYTEWFERWISQLVRCLKDTASVYVCCDWQCSSAVRNVLERHFIIRNRITWEREKGRGALTNWKNCSEDIWYCTVSERYTFNVEAVKLRRKVIAPYRDNAGNPKDWNEGEDGNHRLSHPSNLWTDITVPFWSMPENTDHPTQKPEKLIAKLVLASSNPGDFIFDPFLGSGTTAVVAKKLGRKFSGVEREEEYCLLTAKRLAIADTDLSIQGYQDGVFWERNTLNQQR